MSILDLIKTRRSIFPEQFNSKEIDDETIDILLESANWAPTHKKTEPWRFKIIRGDSKIRLGEFLARKYKENTAKFSEYKFKKLLKKPILSSVVLLICMQRDHNESIPEWEEVAAVSMARYSRRMVPKSGSGWITSNGVVVTEVSEVALNVTS